MGVFSMPGLHTDVQTSHNLTELAALGYEWISYQVQNDTQTKQRSLQAARSAGLSPGVWGVSYHQEFLERDARLLRALAEDSGADHVIFNVESVMNPRPYIDVFKTFPGSKALITLVGILPDLDIEQLLAAGWDIMPEAYYNDLDTLAPATAKWYCDREGIPTDRYNIVLGMYSGMRGKISGAEYVQLLQQGGVGNNFSAWMLEQAPMEDFIQLAAHIDPIRSTLDKLALGNTGINAVLDRLEQVFDAQGIGEPDGIDALRKHLLASGAKINEIVDFLNAQ